VAQGVLGFTTPSGDIFVVSGWNWYTGADAGAVGGAQYDYQTVLTHELGHGVGLEHSSDPNSVMYAALAAGAARRAFTAQDLAQLNEASGGGGALMEDTEGHALLAAGPSAVPVAADTAGTVPQNLSVSGNAFVPGRPPESATRSTRPAGFTVGLDAPPNGVRSDPGSLTPSPLAREAGSTAVPGALGRGDPFRGVPGSALLSGTSTQELFSTSGNGLGKEWSDVAARGVALDNLFTARRACLTPPALESGLSDENDSLEALDTYFASRPRPSWDGASGADRSGADRFEWFPGLDAGDDADQAADLENAEIGSTE
jgi:hypothetical protein